MSYSFVSLLVPQRRHWLHARSTLGGYDARQERDAAEHNQQSRESQWVGSSHFKQQAANQSGEHESKEQSDAEPNRCHGESLSHDHLEDIGATGPEGHAD